MALITSDSVCVLCVVCCVCGGRHLVVSGRVLIDELVRIEIDDALRGRESVSTLVVGQNTC